MTEAKHSKQLTTVSNDALNQLFREARTHNAWLPKRAPIEALREAYELARWGPTSANSSPARFVFLESEAAPVTAIVAWDAEFYEKLPKLFPHADMRPHFAGNQAVAEETAFRNSSLQGGYFIIAARAVGLDCGPMSGFDKAKVNAEFFSDGKWKVNFLCNLGYGDHSKLFPRSPRLEFDEACRVL